MPNGRLFRDEPTPKNAAKDYEQIYTGEPVGGFTIQADGSLLLLKTNGTVETWREGKVTSVVEEIAEVKGTRFNDAIADPEGRVFSGTMAKDNIKGRLYRIDPDGSIHEILQVLLVPIGMGVSLDYRYFYLTDSDQHAICRFDYDLATVHICNQLSLIKIPTDKGVPDGMTVD
ncbi:MAG: SMP-30/gluconolactonase/LRE family protein, partial [Phormidesmis sp.]